MIHILFPGGAFGSTLEYCLRNFSQEFDSIDADVLTDGSMHGYKKEFHPVTVEEFQNIDATMQIITPVYPNRSLLSVSDTINEFIKVSGNHKVIFVILNTTTLVERNWLYFYHKIGIDPQVCQLDPTPWNKNYKSFNDMNIWEQRELLSYIINDTMAEYLSANDIGLPNWLTITTDDILFNFRKTLEQLFKYLELTLNPDGLDTFIYGWSQKQQYVLDEMKLIDDILINFQNKNVLEWGSLSLMGEAIVQSRLARLGYEFRCYNLTQFPTSTTELFKLC
jgi:hypothetical protein